MLTVAIIGRPNVGKTTLFNKLNKKKLAIAHNMPGVTRDRKSAIVRYKDMRFNLIDTAGLENAKNLSDLSQKTVNQSMIAVDEANICLFMIDGTTGITKNDEVFAKMLHKKGKGVLLLVNKCESEKRLKDDQSIHKVNYKSLFYISAEHGIGIEDLLKYLAKEDAKHQKEIKEVQGIEESEEEEYDRETSFCLAFVGMPNAGKSSIINNILNEERLVTDSVAGTTRDSISIPIVYNGLNIKIVDTAGIKKRINIKDDIEEMSVEESFRAIDFAHVVVIVVDVEKGICHQDKALMNKVLEEGRAMIILVNKWDLVPPSEQKEVLKELRDSINQMQIKNYTADIFTTSAMKDKNLKDILGEAASVYHKWNSKVPTKKLNDWLHEKLLPARHTPKINNRYALKLKFISQTLVRPPTFTISSNFTEIPHDYISFIRNRIIQDFGLNGMPIRLVFKKDKNPFLPERKQKVSRKRYKT